MQITIKLQQTRRGLTLIELLISVSIMSLTTLSLGMLARAVQISSAYNEGNGAAAQHAQVTLERIEKAVTKATANEIFPGAVVFAESVSGNRFPDTLVVWKPDTGTVAADAMGLPRFCELVVFCPNPNLPSQLLEITSRSDTRTIPALSNTSQWTTELSTLKTGNASRKIILTDLLRTASLNSGSTQRSCVRFEVALRPTAEEITAYRNGTTAWDAILWPQGWYGSTTGLRQTWVRSELQLLPNSISGGIAASDQAIPFFGSAALYYEISR